MISTQSEIGKVERIYLDHAASTPCNSEVAELMKKTAVDVFGNSSSGHHEGRVAARAISNARHLVAECLGSFPEEIIFTSGATESNNVAILGIADFALRNGGSRNKILYLPIEHSSVIEPIKSLQSRGYETKFLPIKKTGRVNFELFESLVDEKTLLVCVQLANNEIGTIQPIADLAEVAHEKGALFHCDAVQALGKIEFNLGELGVDSASLSAHKCYGPKGVGALWLSGGAKNAAIDPTYRGGSQEYYLRPGTLNSPAIVGFGKAIEIAKYALQKDIEHLQNLRDAMEARIKAGLPNITINGDLSQRLPSLTSITFPDTNAEDLLARLDEYDLSTSSACHFGGSEPSHVLKAIGLTNEQANCSIRLAFGRSNSSMHAERFAERVVEEVRFLHRFK